MLVTFYGPENRHIATRWQMYEVRRNITYFRLREGAKRGRYFESRKLAFSPDSIVDCCFFRTNREVQSLLSKERTSRRETLSREQLW